MNRKSKAQFVNRTLTLCVIEPIRAWKRGLVVHEMWDVELWDVTSDEFRGSYLSTGQSDNLCQDNRDTIDAVLEFYGDENISMA